MEEGAFGGFADDISSTSTHTLFGMLTQISHHILILRQPPVVSELVFHRCLDVFLLSTTMSASKQTINRKAMKKQVLAWIAECTKNELDTLQDAIESRFMELDSAQEEEKQAEEQEAQHPLILREIQKDGVSIQVQDCGEPPNTVVIRSKVRLRVQKKRGKTCIVGMSSDSEQLQWVTSLRFQHPLQNQDDVTTWTFGPMDTRADGSATVVKYVYLYFAPPLPSCPSVGTQFIAFNAHTGAVESYQVRDKGVYNHDGDFLCKPQHWTEFRWFIIRVQGTQESN